MSASGQTVSDNTVLD